MRNFIHAVRLAWDAAISRYHLARWQQRRRERITDHFGV